MQKPADSKADAATSAFLSDAQRLTPKERQRLLAELERYEAPIAATQWRRLPGMWTLLTALTVALHAAAFARGHFSLSGFCWYSGGELLSDIARYPANCQNVCAGLTSVPIEPANITREKFARLYAYTGRPVLVKGAASHWPASHHWNLSFFRDLYDRFPNSYRIQERRARYLPFRIELQSFREALHMPPEREAHPYYFGFSNFDHRVHNELKKYFEWPSYLPLGSQGSVLDWIFIGAAEYGAPVHLDHILRPSWQALIMGKKTWDLWPPSECSSVCSRLAVTMEPGDILNVDTNQWYHATYNEPGHFSMTIGAEYD